MTERPARTDAAIPPLRRLCLMVERRPRRHGRWTTLAWQIVGVLPDPDPAAAPEQRCVRAEGEHRLYRWSGLPLRLIADATEDYWYNLDSAGPQLYALCYQDLDGELRPSRLTVDADEAVAAQETQGTVLEAPLPPELADWVRDYVLAHFRPGPRKGPRKRDLPPGTLPG
jgi:hypothetical protein